ncbi:MAG: ATP-dependent DNA ligase [Burkholderiaceae bacterium]
MKYFSRLFSELDASTATRDKQAALVRYFVEIAQRSIEQGHPAGAMIDATVDNNASKTSTEPERDAAWAVYFLAGGKPRQTVPPRILRETARTVADLPEWLFEESYQAVGDLAETIAHILPPPSRHSELGLARWIEERLLALKGESPETISHHLADWWDELDTAERFLLTKLIGGGFRVGVSKLSVTRALATVSGIDPKIVAHRLMGYTDGRARPSAANYRALIAPTASAENEASPEGGPFDSHGAYERRGQPYPFFLAHALNEPIERFDALLGSIDDWQVEWKYDGIRGQLVVRDGEAFLWSRGEDLVTERFPEMAALSARIPDGTVIDGEILVWHANDTNAADTPASFADLQTRIGRKTLSKKILAEKPVVLVAYDLLEQDGADLRGEPQAARRARLEALVAAIDDFTLRLSPVLRADSWPSFATLRNEARARGVEGFMLKRRDARYGVGRTKDVGTWWKWKIDPLSVDAVLIYAQRGHGRRASLYTDFTFAVWDREPGVEADRARTLIPFAKAYSGLTDEEMAKVDAIVKKTTIEKFGPVRSVKPTQVFELGFEGIQRSSRHKSGIAVRFPRMLRWRIDKPIEEADTIASLQSLLDAR